MSTDAWLILAAASDDLRRRVVFLAQRLAQEHGEISTLGVAGFGVAETLLAGGAFELAKAELDSLTLPSATAGTSGLVGILTAVHAKAAALNGRPGDAAAAMDAAADMADRFGQVGEADPLGFGEFGPTWVGFRRVRLALDAGEPDRAVGIAEGLHPERNPFPYARAFHWVGYGRALAQLRGRRADAVRALRRAETMNPVRVRRNPFVRDTIAVLFPGARGDAIGQELRDMAARCGLLGSPSGLRLRPETPAGLITFTLVPRDEHHA